MKRSSYQKLKDRIRELEIDIYNILELSDDHLCMTTRLKYKASYAEDKQIMHGDGCNGNIKGIITSNEGSKPSNTSDNTCLNCGSGIIN